MSTNRKRADQRTNSHRRGRLASPGVEPLEGRALLSAIDSLAALYSGGRGSPPAHVSPPPKHSPPARVSGIVSKAPRFYEAYTGPKLSELNAVKASGVLRSNGAFTFTGTNRGRISTAPAVYVWGIDRSGNLPAGPFQNRPNVRFDAVVVVTLDSSLTPSTKVVDLASGATTNLPAGSASVRGKTVSVTVPGAILPSTGLAPSQYRFNYWPEDGGPPTSSSVASFAPEFTTAQVGSR